MPESARRAANRGKYSDFARASATRADGRAHTHRYIRRWPAPPAPRRPSSSPTTRHSSATDSRRRSSRRATASIDDHAAPRNCWRASGPTSRSIDLLVLDLRLPHSPGVDLVARDCASSTQDACRSSSSAARSPAPTKCATLAALGVAGYINEYSAAQHILPSLAPHLFPDNFNRRSSPRMVLGIPVQYRFGNSIAAALTLNLSHGGVAIRTTSPARGGHARAGALPAARRRSATSTPRAAWPGATGASAWASSSRRSTPASPDAHRHLRRRALLLEPQSLESRHGAFARRQILWRFWPASWRSCSRTDSSSRPSSRSSRSARRASIS